MTLDLAKSYLAIVGIFAFYYLFVPSITLAQSQMKSKSSLLGYEMVHPLEGTVTLSGTANDTEFHDVVRATYTFLVSPIDYERKEYLVKGLIQLKLYPTLEALEADKHIAVIDCDLPRKGVQLNVMSIDANEKNPFFRIGCDEKSVREPPTQQMQFQVWIRQVQSNQTRDGKVVHTLMFPSLNWLSSDWEGKVRNVGSITHKIVIVDPVPKLIPLAEFPSLSKSGER